MLAVAGDGGSADAVVGGIRGQTRDSRLDLRHRTVAGEREAEPDAEKNQNHRGGSSSDPPYTMRLRACGGCRALRLSGRRPIFRWRADRCKKAISAAGNGLDEDGILGRVTQSVAHALDGRVEAVVEVNEGISRPQAIAQIVASDDLSRLFQKQRQYLERLLLDLD